jgi:hypothetical protein
MWFECAGIALMFGCNNRMSASLIFTLHFEVHFYFVMGLLLMHFCLDVGYGSIRCYFQHI